MDRREFLKTLARYGAAAGAGLVFGGPRLLFGQDRTGASPYDLVAVRGGAPERMFREGIAAFGGMSAFVSSGSVVVIKPNASWSMEPERGATTNPKLVGEIVKHCVEAGAKKVYVLDHTIDHWERAYEVTGIKRYTELEGGQIVPGNSKGYYHEVKVAAGAVLKTALVHELVIEADVFINVPILKHHGSTRVTSALKNLMGVVWDRNYYHRSGLNQCIADFPLFRTPTLNIVDADKVMMSGGPRGSSHLSSLEQKGVQILSTDIVAVDTAAVRTWGTDPDQVPYIGMAENNRLGRSNLDLLNIKRIVL